MKKDKLTEKDMEEIIEAVPAVVAEVLQEPVRLTQEEFEVELQRLTAEASASIANPVLKQDSFVGSPKWEELLQLINNYKLSNYKICHYIPNEVIPELETLGTLLEDGEGEPYVVIVSDSMKLKDIPKCHAEHYITISLPSLNITRIDR